MAKGEPNVNERAASRSRLHLRGVVDQNGPGVDEPDYDGVGAELRLARESSGLTRAEFASRLKIREPYLGAIEDGNFDDLPGSVYAVGFIRSYADAVGLDGEEFVSRFKHETAARPDQTRLRFPAPAVESRLPSGRLLFVSLFLVGAVYAGWYYFSIAERSVVEQVPGVPERLLAKADSAIRSSTVSEGEVSFLNKTENESGLSRANAATASVLLIKSETTRPAESTDALSGGGALVETAADQIEQSGSPSTAPGVAPANDDQAGPLRVSDLSETLPDQVHAVAAPQAQVQSATFRTEIEGIANPPLATHPSTGPELKELTLASPAPDTDDLRQRPGRERTTGQAQDLALDLALDVDVEIVIPKTQSAASDVDIEQPTTPTTTIVAALSVPEPPATHSNGQGSDEASLTPRIYGNGGGESRVVLTARLDSWVQVVSEDNEMLLTRILRAGDTYHVPNRSGLLLLTGNAGALELSVDGQALPPIGPIGAVRRNVSLDPEHLLSATQRRGQ